MSSAPSLIALILRTLVRPRTWATAALALASALAVLPVADNAAARGLGGHGYFGSGAGRSMFHMQGGPQGSFRAYAVGRGNNASVERRSFVRRGGIHQRIEGGSRRKYGARPKHAEGTVIGRLHHPRGDGGYGKGTGERHPVHRPHRPPGDGRIVATEPGREGHPPRRPPGDGYPPRRPHPPHFPHHPYWPPVVVSNPPAQGGVVDSGGSGNAGGPPARTFRNGGGGGGGAGGGPVTRRAGTGVPPANEQRYVPDEVVLELAPGITEQAAQAIAGRHQLVRLASYNSQLTGTTVVRWRIPDGRAVPAVVQTLEADGAVISAQPNYLFALTQADQSDDPTEGDPAQYALAKLHLALAHRFATGTRVRVAVIDSGVDIGNPDLAGDIAASFDPVGKGEKVHKHGTAVAGVIAAHGRLMGAAPAAQLLVVRAFADDAGDDGTTFAITQGLDWAAQNGARVINMSFTGPQDPQIARHIASAYDKGIVLVAAMGNMGPDSPSLYPAADSHVIAVTATDADDALPEFASHGNHVAVAAPGVDLMMLAPDGQLQFSSGTSFSAPFVSGTIALMLERRPGLTPAEARRTLMQTAKDLGPKGFDPEFGAGLVDAYKAVMSVAPATVGTARR